MNLDLSIVVPTYKECPNIEHLLRRISNALADKDIHYQVILVDDNSNDGIESLVPELAEYYPVELIVRRRHKGLATAVITGLGHAEGKVAVVMDADLSHPPESIPEMYAAVASGSSDFVLGSRYLGNPNSIKGWGLYRQLNSAVATLLARPLTPFSDPMSGFFAFPLEKLPELHLLSPVGFKVALEIFVKGDFGTPTEITIEFTDRVRGKSKLTLSEQLQYLRHLRRLYHFKYPVVSEFVQFAAVGSAGLVLDLTVFLITYDALSINHYIARCIAFVCAASSNWYLNRVITFSTRKKTRKLLQWPKFLISATVSFGINFGIYAALTTYVEFFMSHYVAALLIGVACGLGSNFMFSHLFVFIPYDRDDIRLTKTDIEKL